MSDDNNERIHHGQYGMRQRAHTLVSDRDAREQQKREAPLLKEMSIQIIPVTVNHLKAFACLPTMAGHPDPDDRLIISQAISDHIPLISSDHKFAFTARRGWTFVLMRDNKTD